MADVKISALPVGTVFHATDIVPFVDNSGTPTTKSMTSTILFTSPVMITPTLGVASATSVNKVTLTAPATAATLTILNNKTLTINKTLTFDGTDGQTMTFPGTSATLARTDAGQTFTGTQAFGAITSTSTITDTQSIAAVSTDGLVLQNTTAAAAGAQQWSPRLHFIGQGWKTTATAGSQSVDWIAEVQPVQGAANPTSNLVFSSSINGGAFATGPVFGSDLSTTLPATGIFTAGGTNILNSTYLGSTATNSGTSNVSSAQFGLRAAAPFGWTANTNPASALDTQLTRFAAATLQFGAADAVAPILQTTRTQSTVAGTSNTAGVNWVRQVSAGTGTGAGGDHVWQVAPAGTTGTAQNAFVEAFRITSNGVFGIRGTDTPIGTTGAQTISRPSGTVNFAAAATSLVVTNTLCTSTTKIQATIQTADTTMKSVVAVASSGSFTLTANAAATGTTQVYWELRTIQ